MILPWLSAYSFGSGSVYVCRHQVETPIPVDGNEDSLAITRPHWPHSPVGQHGIVRTCIQFPRLCSVSVYYPNMDVTRAVRQQREALSVW